MLNKESGELLKSRIIAGFLGNQEVSPHQMRLIRQITDIVVIALREYEKLQDESNQ